jgi:hypothetical protein
MAPPPMLLPVLSLLIASSNGVVAPSCRRRCHQWRCGCGKQRSEKELTPMPPTTMTMMMMMMMMMMTMSTSKATVTTTTTTTMMIQPSAKWRDWRRRLCRSATWTSTRRSCSALSKACTLLCLTRTSAVQRAGRAALDALHKRAVKLLDAKLLLSTNALLHSIAQPQN